MLNYSPTLSYRQLILLEPAKTAVYHALPEFILQHGQIIRIKVPES